MMPVRDFRSAIASAGEPLARRRLGARRYLRLLSRVHPLICRLPARAAKTLLSVDYSNIIHIRYSTQRYGRIIPERRRSMEIKDRVKELRRVRASELVPNPKNWRTHPTAQA